MRQLSHLTPWFFHPIFLEGFEVFLEAGGVQPSITSVGVDHVHRGREYLVIIVRCLALLRAKVEVEVRLKGCHNRPLPIQLIVLQILNKDE